MELRDRSIKKSQQKFARAGFSTLEYVILLFVVIFAFTAMFLYLKSAICGSYREAIDAFGDGRLFFPYITNITRIEP